MFYFTENVFKKDSNFPNVGVIFVEDEEILNETILCSVEMKQLEIKNETVSVIHAKIPKEIFPLGLENYDLLDDQSKSKNFTKKDV